jgi:hypothetical protein
MNAASDGIKKYLAKTRTFDTAASAAQRIYDFDRVDEQGNKRELHTEAALAALDYGVYQSPETDGPIRNSYRIVHGCLSD